ncbi:MAG TPA: 2-C-methyl-D-erythritol 2,4-cyclodiphosphate synthase [Bdellovibrionota bacterium]|nr:2-C-methyl-D-erythritol 2,4-cyclodiphosphate synthase [Bdellovibrionota bacterium]
MSGFRIGQGFDVHPFARDRKLILGGVEIPHAAGLAGHSDADALCHAICDALLGAMSLGDMGQHFPDTDPKYRGKSSLFFLERVSALVAEKGWRIANIDSTIVTEDPILRPHIDPMRRKIAQTLQLEADRVSVKATRPEKLGALGRKEGLLVLAMALLQK